MIHKRHWFSIILLTTLGAVSARVAEKREDISQKTVTTEERSEYLPEKDFFSKPFTEDLYSAEVTGKFAMGTELHRGNSLLNTKAESAFGKTIDRVAGSKAKLDLVGNIVYETGAEVQVGFRAKSALGNPRAYNTTKEFIKLNEALIGEHSHMLEPRVFFMREAWVSIDLTKALTTRYTLNNFKVGLFPFEVGRGIALGESYGAGSPTSLGFYGDSSVDQYTPGLLLNGSILKTLDYDLYAGLLTNLSTNLKETGSQIYDQLLINNAYPTNFARGSGRINYVVASRLKWTPVNDKAYGDKVYFEPYVVYNSAPEQKVEFTGDAKSRLITLGLAGEFATVGYEFGFETAMNRGHQDVYAWDRNKVTITTDSTTGVVTQKYTKVYDNAGLTTKTAYTGDTAAYRPTGVVSSDLNGLAIGATGKFHASDRFRDAYRNKYKGWMFVTDASIDLYRKDLKLAITGGITSGDVNPNTDKTGLEREYKGFIPLQEMYFGKRVKSFFVMGPTSSLARPYSLVNDDDFTSPIEGFSNLKFVGGGITYKPEEATRKYSVNTNMLVFWQKEPSLKYGSTTEYASNKLGLEMNLFSSVELVDNIKLTAAGAVFKPLDHYKDLKGTQLTIQRAELTKLAAAGITENLPTLSDDTAVSFSCGIECIF